MSSSSDEMVEDGAVDDETKPKITPRRQLIPVNNVNGLQQKLSDIQLHYDWIEKLDISVNTESLSTNGQNEASNPLADSDFQREMSFYNQSLAAVKKAFKRLKKLGIPTKRPTDYFAEMAKSDSHMLKVREKLLSKQTAVERIEKVRSIREQKKLGKKIQQEVIQQRKQEKKKMITALKKTKKGKMGADSLLNEKKAERSNKNSKSKKNREFRDSKYGYGGKKKGSKYNTADSSAGDSWQGGKKGGSFNRTPKFGKQRMKKKPRRRR